MTLDDKSIARIEAVKDIEGEVSMNVRKGRLRQIFDLTISLTVAYEEEDYAVKIVDWMSDTDFAGFEMEFSRLPKPVREPLRKAVWAQLLVFRTDLEESHGKTLLVSSAQTPNATESEEAKPKFHGVFDSSVPSMSSPKGTDRIEQKMEFPVPASFVYEALTSPDRIRQWTRGTASLASFEPGASFSLLNGNIMGTVTRMEPGTRLLMDWRLKHWPSDVVSQVDIAVKSTSEGACTVYLKQIGVPTADCDAVRDNWHRYYWEPIRTLLGCPSYAML